MVCLGNEQRSSVIFGIASKYCISDSFVDYALGQGRRWGGSTGPSQSQVLRSISRGLPGTGFCCCETPLARGPLGLCPLRALSFGAAVDSGRQKEIRKRGFSPRT